MDRQWLPLLRAAYHLSDSHQAWLREIATASLPTIDCGDGVVAFRYTTSEEGEVEVRELVSASADGKRTYPNFRNVLSRLPRKWRPGAGELPPIHHTVSEHALAMQTDGEPGANVAAVIESTLDQSEFVDALLTHVALSDTEGIYILAPSRKRLDPDLSNRAHWASVAQHIRAGWEISNRLQSGDANRVLQQSGSNSRDNTVPMSPVRPPTTDDESSTRHQKPPRGLWNDMLEGHVSIVDHYNEHLRSRHYILVRHSPHLARTRSLSRREAAAIDSFVRTASGLDVAIALDIAESTARQYIRSAMIKLGVTHRSELLQIAFAVGVLRRTTTASNLRPPDRPTHHASYRVVDEDISVLSVPIVPSSRVLQHLTDAECEVCRFVMLGWSSDQIAAERGTSERTVANQLASIFRKLEITDRYELANMLLGARKDGSHIVGV